LYLNLQIRSLGWGSVEMWNIGQNLSLDGHIKNMDFEGLYLKA